MNYNRYKQAVPATVYLADPNLQRIYPVGGIRSAHLTEKFNDIWEISFAVDSEINGKENPCYSFLLPMRELKVEGYGWFRINEMPTEEWDGTTHYKTFTAYGLETQLQDIDLVTFYINCGNSVSREMYEENLNPLGIPIRGIRFYIPEESNDPASPNYWELGLLNILQREKFSKKGWTIGDVDLELQSMVGRKFEVDSQDVYSFLINSVSPAYRCIFVFDRINKRINVRNLEEIGDTVNIECSFRNLINSATVTDQNTQIYTRFNVAGNDDLTSISYVNFGSEQIENLSYFINAGIIRAPLAEKYTAWVDAREAVRQTYATNYVTYREALQNIANLENLVPINQILTPWEAMTLEQLEAEYNAFVALLDYYESETEFPDGITDEDKEYPNYTSIKDVILPDIMEAIENKGHEFQRVDYKTNFELYGINELNAKLQIYTNNKELLEEKGYDVPWSPEIAEEDPSHVSQEAHDAQYASYLQICDYIDDINDRLEILEEKRDEYQQQADAAIAAMRSIEASVDINNPNFEFTQTELAVLNALYIDTDFTDSSVEINDSTDYQQVIDRAFELLQLAQEELEIECRPQLSYSLNLDNPLFTEKFSDKFNELNMGDFVFLTLDNKAVTKQRVVQVSYELVDFSDTSYELQFSDMITAYGKSNDYRFLLSSGNTSSKNSISKSITDYVNEAATSAALSVIGDMIKSGNGLNASFSVDGMSNEDLLKLSDMLQGLVDGNLTVDELKVKLAEVDTLSANSAFVNYLNSQYLVGNQASFQSLSALTANIQNALLGTAVAQTGIVINLTADNIHAIDATVANMVAAHLSVADLAAGDITVTNTARILSENGQMIMNGSAMQFGKEVNGQFVPSIQIGYATNDEPSIIIKDENGATILTSSGITSDAIADNLIVNNMIGSSAVTNRNMDWSTISYGVDANGKPTWDLVNIYMNGQQFGAQYTSFVSDVNGDLADLQTQIDNIELEEGVGVQDIVRYYGISNSTTTPPSTWGTTIPSKGAGEYLWWYDEYELTNGNTVTLDPICSIDGTSVEVAAIEYQAGTSGTTPPTGTWSTSIPVVPDGGYLWTRVTYTDQTQGYSVAYQGTNGDSPTVYKLESSNYVITKDKDDVIAPSSITFTATAQTGDMAVQQYAGRFLIETTQNNSTWTEVYRSTSNESTYTFTVPASIVGIRCSLYKANGLSTLLDSQIIPVIADGKDGTNGTDGNDGASIHTVTVWYAVSEDDPSIVVPTSLNWVQSVPVVDEGEWLWTKTVTDYTSVSIPDTVVYSYSKQGQQGQAGTSVTIVSIQYQSGDSPTSPPIGTWSDSPVVVSEGEYLWSKTTFSDGNVSYGVARQGVDGEDGQNGQDAYTVILSNEAQAFAGNASGAFASSASTTVVGYKGATKQTVSVSQSAITGLPTGMTASVGTQSGDVLITFTVTPSMNTDSGTVTIPVVMDGKTFNKTFSYTLTRNGSDGAPGSSPTIYSLSVSNEVIVKDKNGAYSPTSITVSAASQTGNETAIAYSGRFKIETTTNNTSWTSRYTSSSNESSHSYTLISGIVAVRCSLYKAGGTSVLLDQQVIPVVSDGTDGTNGHDGQNGQDGDDAYTIILSNESHTFAGDSTGAFSASTSTLVIGYKGTEKQTVTIGTITGLPTGMTASVGTSGGEVAITFAVSQSSTKMNTASGTVTIPVTLDGRTFNKTFSYALARNGNDGANGSTIWTTVAEPTTPNYTFNISALNGPSGETVKVGDLVLQGYYRFTVQSVGQTTVLTGDRTSIRGATGAAGTGLVSILPQYCLSASKQTAPTTGWSYEMPEEDEDKPYLWIRYEVTYTDSQTPD